MKKKYFKTVVNYALNPFASFRNPFKSQLTRDIERGVAISYLELSEKRKAIGLNELTASQIESKCGELKKKAIWFFMFAVFLLLTSGLAIFTLHLSNEITFIRLFALFNSALVSLAFLAASIKQAFLAHGVENNLKFSYANPLEYIKENYHVYLKWIVLNEPFQSQNK